ncbi:MAG: phosphoadenosine phosphosulfate reductase family protein [Bacteroidales bacterium]
MNIVSFSGGKDSTAMLLRMIELNYQIDKVVFADTTLEYPEMYDWINKIDKIVKEKIGINIERTYPSHSFDEHFYGCFTKGKLKGRRRGFPLRKPQPCYWTLYGKKYPTRKAHGKNNIIYMGIAVDEKKRTKSKIYQKQKNKYKFPLVEWNWTEQDCYNYLLNKKLPHPFRKIRTGCWLCPNHSIKTLKMLYNNYPKLWKKLKQYEADSPQGFKPNLKLKDIEYKVKQEKRQKTINDFKDERIN